VIRNETLLRSARTAAMPSRRSRHLRDALVSATCKLGRIDALNLCVFSGSQIIMMPCSENPPCFRLYTSPPAYFIFVNISCICYLVSLRSGMVERLKGAIGSREDRKKVHIPEHRARHRHLSTESSTTSSACAKFIGFRPLRSTYILKSLSKLSLTISILLGTFVVSSPIRQPPPSFGTFVSIKVTYPYSSSLLQLST
jgi:hypothetical protein